LTLHFGFINIIYRRYGFWTKIKKIRIGKGLTSNSWLRNLVIRQTAIFLMLGT